jgi:hypothetical protein
MQAERVAIRIFSDFVEGETNDEFMEGKEEDEGGNTRKRCVDE